MQQELPTEIVIAIERVIQPSQNEHKFAETNVQDTLNQLFPDGLFTLVTRQNVV